MIPLSKNHGSSGGMQSKELSDRARRWLHAHPPAVMNQLIELAAADDWLAARIISKLNLGTKPKTGRRVKVTDDRLIELRGDGLTYAAIASAVGMSVTQVGTRIRKIKASK